MNFIDNEDIAKDIYESIPNVLKIDLENNKELVKTNINYLKELGVEKYIEIFKSYYPMFLMDYSSFVNIFNKYDKSDLIDKIDKNISIIEHL